jgi:hypothetical protein
MSPPRDARASRLSDEVAKAAERPGRGSGWPIMRLLLFSAGLALVAASVAAIAALSR